MEAPANNTRPLGETSAVLVEAATTVPGNEPPCEGPGAAASTKATPVQIVLIVLGTIAFLYFARPVLSSASELLTN